MSGILRTDTYTARMWASLRDVPRKALVEAAIPDGHALHVTHGGSRYRASLRRDGEVIAERTETFLRMAIKVIPLDDDAA